MFCMAWDCCRFDRTFVGENHIVEKLFTEQEKKGIIKTIKDCHKAEQNEAAEHVAERRIIYVRAVEKRSL